MSISNNTLAAFLAGTSTVQEDEAILKELSESKSFSELLDVLEEVDAIDGLDELRQEFNETSDNYNELTDYNINIK